MISKYKFRIKLHSFHIASLLAVGTLVGSVAIGLFIQQNPIINKFDALLYDKISNGFHHPFLDLLVWPININFLPLGFVPSYFYPWITGMLLYLLIFRRKLLPWALLCFILGTVIAYIITYIDWKLVYRERPFVTLPSQVDETWRAIWSNFSSFPSGHARETTLYATFTAAYIPKLKWVMVLFVLFVGWSRVYVGAHFPTDVIAGIAIGFLTAKVTLLIVRELQLIQQNMKAEKEHATLPKTRRA